MSEQAFKRRVYMRGFRDGAFCRCIGSCIWQDRRQIKPGGPTADLWLIYMNATKDGRAAADAIEDSARIDADKWWPDDDAPAPTGAKEPKP